MSTTLNHRYPGIRSFEAREQDLFFGRSEEIRGLYAQVKTLPLVVLFSKSGIGKSSLLNAGLVPLLELEPFIPFNIRLQDTSISPAAAVKRILHPLADKEMLARHVGPGHPGFWETLRACRFERYGETATPILIFDQFEEFFLHSDAARHDFILDLADLVSERLPNRVRDHLLAIPLEQRTPEDMAWHQPPKVKVVIAIRSDRLSLLDDLSVEIPLILHNRFQLKPLQRTQAREAIVEPALLPGPSFATPPFAYKEETLQLIMDVLTNKSQEIESFQLQLVCRHIELQLLQRLKSYPAGQRLEANESIVGSREDILSIINDYYEKSIDDLPDEYEERARNFIETGLIVGGRRVGVTEGVEKENFGIDADLLGMLVDSRLIRVENTHLGRSFEVSHDALVEPILQSYEKRRLRQEKESAIKAREEQARLLAEEMEKRTHEQKLAHEQRLRKRSRTFAIVTGTLATIGIIGWGVAKVQADEAKSLLIEADNNRITAEYNFKEAQSAVQKYKEAELNLARTKVDIYLNARQPQMALDEIAKARKIDNAASWIQGKEKEAEIMKQQLIVEFSGI